MPTIGQVTTANEIRGVEELLREYAAWVLPLTPVGSDAPTFQGLDQELSTLPGIYAPPTGCLLLATHEGRPAGCIALKRHDDRVAELKRLYVRPGCRGLNLGRALVAALVEEARRMGFQRLVLDSHVSMTGAHALYREAGFRQVETPDDFPEVLKPQVVFMEMTIATTSA